jgi:hypothetical protein
MSESSYCPTVIDNLNPGTDFFRKAWPRRRAKAELRSNLSHLNVEGNSNLTAALIRYSSYSSFSHLFLQNKYSLRSHVAVAPRGAGSCTPAQLAVLGPWITPSISHLFSIILYDKIVLKNNKYLMIEEVQRTTQGSPPSWLKTDNVTCVPEWTLVTSREDRLENWHQLPQK